MKIQNINNYMGYKTNSKSPKNEVGKSKNYDVIDIKSKDNKQDISLTVKKKILSQINEETDAEKINRLRESINDKTYSIDVDEIVSRLLR